MTNRRIFKASAMIASGGLFGKVVSALLSLPSPQVASSGPTVGASETRVSRWMSEGEYSTMKSTGMLQTGANGRTSVTFPGAPQPGGTGPVRVDFNVPTSALQPGGRSDWRIIFDPRRVPVTGIERMTP